MFKNFSLVETPLTSDNWKQLSNEKRIELISEELKKKNLEKFEVFEVPDNGNIVLKVLEPIPSNIRGMLLLDLEDQLKSNIDKGLTAWLEPVGDKSKLRNLRGIVFKSN
jgi:hypothetical protein